MKVNHVRKVAIIGGNRIPFARSNTAYAAVSNQEMLTAALNGLVDRYRLGGMVMGEVAGGAVMKHSRDFNLVRESVLSTQFAPETPCFDLQQACGTGLEAAILVANKIALGQIECGVACGVDTTSDAPISVNEEFRKILLEFNCARNNQDRLKLLMQLRPKHLIPALPANGEPRTGLSMGEHCEITAKEWKILREAQDQLACNSHQNMAKAYEDGFFEDMLTPFLGLEKDNNLRSDTSIEKLATLKPSFDKSGGTLTAGNSTPLTDGASSVLLASEEWAKTQNLPILAYMTYCETAAVDFVVKKEGLLMAPVYAVPRLLQRAELALQDFDYYEIHEAFAAQVLYTLKAWESEAFCKSKLHRNQALGSIDSSRLNVKGSSLAAGHPFAATGGRIVHTLAKLLSDKGSGRGLISVCAAGGQGVTAILEK